MATGFTNSKASEILRSVIDSSTYIALSTTTPEKAGSGSGFTEPSAATGYARAQMGDLNTSISAQVANKNIIFICECVQDMGTVTHVGLCSAKTGSPFLFAELVPSLEISAGYVPLIRANKLIIGLDVDAIREY